MTASSNLTNITLAESADAGLWDDLGGGPGSGQDAGSPIQGAESRSRRVDNTSRGFGFNPLAAVDLSATDTHLGFWALVYQPGLIGANGLEFSLSDSNSDCQSGNWDGHRYPAANYRAIGGWVRVWVDLARAREVGAGTLNLANAINFGCMFNMGDVGGTSNNCHLDRIDYGTAGLSITGGSLGTPETFASAISLDATNAYGVVTADELNGPIQIGGAATVFRDENFAIKAGDQPLAASDWVRIDFDASNGAEDILLGFGFLEGVHLTFAGSSATQADLGGLILSSAPLSITMSAAWSWSGSLINSPGLVQNGATLDGLVIDSGADTVGVTRSLAGTYVGGEVKNCNRGMDVTALINGSNEVTIDGTVFSGNTVDITLSHGVDVTVNLVNGALASTVENTGAGNASLNNAVNVQVTVFDENTGSPIENAHVLLLLDSDKTTQILNGSTNASGVVAATYNHLGDVAVVGWARQMDILGTDYTPKNINGTITSSGLAISVGLSPITV